MFTLKVSQLLSDEQYAKLQEDLVRRPNDGDVITGTGGLRKLRWVTEGRGKRGGTRVIYYHHCFADEYPHDPDLSERSQRRSDAPGKEGTAGDQCEVVKIYLWSECDGKNYLKSMLESMHQHEEIRRGARAPSREFHFDATRVKEIRAITGLSQPKFAKLLDINVGTLRNWEQGHREPTGPARALLRAIKANPKAVLKALAA